MIDISAYRARIGGFTPPGRRRSKNLDQKRSFRLAVLIIMLVILADHVEVVMERKSTLAKTDDRGCSCPIEQFMMMIVVITAISLLMLCGDVESNPGPQKCKACAQSESSKRTSIWDIPEILDVKNYEEVMLKQLEQKKDKNVKLDQAAKTDSLNDHSDQEALALQKSDKEFRSDEMSLGGAEQQPVLATLPEANHSDNRSPEEIESFVDNVLRPLYQKDELKPVPAMETTNPIIESLRQTIQLHLKQQRSEWLLFRNSVCEIIIQAQNSSGRERNMIFDVLGSALLYGNKPYPIPKVPQRPPAPELVKSGGSKNEKRVKESCEIPEVNLEQDQPKKKKKKVSGAGDQESIEVTEPKQKHEKPKKIRKIESSTGDKKSNEVSDLKVKPTKDEHRWGRELTPHPTIDNKHELPSYICDKEFNTEWTHFDPSEYNRVKGDGKSFSCNKCTNFNDCRNKFSFRIHVFGHLSIKPFTCCGCGKNFKRKGEVQRHFTKTKCDVANKNKRSEILKQYTEEKDVGMGKRTTVDSTEKFSRQDCPDRKINQVQDEQPCHETKEKHDDGSDNAIVIEEQFSHSLKSVAVESAGKESKRKETISKAASKVTKEITQQEFENHAKVVKHHNQVYFRSKNDMEKALILFASKTLPDLYDNDRRIVLTSQASLSMDNEVKILMNNNRWLNDTIIDEYLKLLDRNTPLVGKTTFSFPASLYKQYRESGFNSVRRCGGSRAHGLLERKFVLFPINVLNNHWALVVLDTEKKCFFFYDGYRSKEDKKLRCTDSSGQPPIKTIKQYINNKIGKETSAGNVLDYDEMEPKDIPQQRNGDDCGTFLCSFAKHLCIDQPMNFTENDMPMMRREILYSLVKDKIVMLSKF